MTTHREAQALGRLVTAAQRVADDWRARPPGWTLGRERARLAELVAAVDNLDAVRAALVTAATKE